VKQRSELLEYLRHHRHDWLNVIQILKGQLSLGKIEDAQKYLDQQIIKAHYESKITALGHAGLAFELITYNWKQNVLLLEVEIEDIDEGRDQDLTNRYPILINGLPFILTQLQGFCEKYEENHLLLVLQVYPEQLLMIIEMEGTFKQYEQERALEGIEAWIKAEQGSLSIICQEPDQFQLEIKL